MNTSPKELPADQRPRFARNTFGRTVRRKGFTRQQVTNISDWILNRRIAARINSHTQGVN